MKSLKSSWPFALAIAAIASASACYGFDQTGLTGEFSLPDRSHNLVDSQDDYYDAVQRLQDADAAVVRAREAAMKEAQSSPDYVAAVKAVDSAYQAFIQKKNALVDDLEKKNQIYCQMKAQTSTINSQIESARQNPATTPDQFEELYKNRETFVRQWQQLETDAMDRAGVGPLRQQWLDASKKLADLQAKQRVDVEATDKLKSALAMADDARAAVQQARAALGGTNSAIAATGDEQSRPGDFLCRYSGSSFIGNDAWWTYGWNTLTPGGKPPGK
jgi:flagellin-like hook-associated protein FlgL